MRHEAHEVVGFCVFFSILVGPGLRSFSLEFDLESDARSRFSGHGRKAARSIRSAACAQRDPLGFEHPARLPSGDSARLHRCVGDSAWAPSAREQTRLKHN
jgi:hypothetical protein